jgi:hypothetical protein
MRMEVTEAEGPYRLSIVVAMSVVLRVEQAWQEARREQDTAWLQSNPISGKFVLRRGHPEVDPQTQVGQRAGRESQCRGE